jgi:hypothetical protein
MGGQESSIVTDYILKVRFASCNTRDDFFLSRNSNLMPVARIYTCRY